MVGAAGITKDCPAEHARVMSGSFLFAALIIMKSEHETSKVALLWSTLIFLVARSGVERSSRILQVTWVVACLAVIPAALSLQRLNLYQASCNPAVTA